MASDALAFRSRDRQVAALAAADSRALPAAGRRECAVGEAPARSRHFLASARTSPSWGEAGTTSCGDTAVLLYSVACKAGRVPSSLSLAATGGLGCTPFPAACDGAFRSAGACTGRPRSRVVTSYEDIFFVRQQRRHGLFGLRRRAAAWSRPCGRQAAPRRHAGRASDDPPLPDLTWPLSLAVRGRKDGCCTSRGAVAGHDRVLSEQAATGGQPRAGVAGNGVCACPTGGAATHQPAAPAPRGCLLRPARVPPQWLRGGPPRSVPPGAGAGAVQRGVRPSDSHARATRASCPAPSARGVAHLGSRQPTGSPSCSAPPPTRADPSARRPPGWRPPGKRPRLKCTVRFRFRRRASHCSETRGP